MPTALDRRQIAERIRRELLRAIDHEIQVDRLVADAHYARDVLLVCDALMGSDLPLLAALYRDAAPMTPMPAAAQAESRASGSPTEVAHEPVRAWPKAPAGAANATPWPVGAPSPVAAPAGSANAAVARSADGDVTPARRRQDGAGLASTSTLEPPGHAHQATEWSRHTSGFGVSRPAPLGAEDDRRRSWLARLRRS